ncbi:MAG: DUF86 domain-containing protein [Bacillota bacterium]
MVDRKTVERRLLKLEQSLRKLEELSRISWDEYRKDEGLRDRVERNLQIAAQVCIDIGSHVIADRGFRPPYGYGDIFTILREEGLLPESLAGTMRQIAGFRNILVHDYLEIDQRIVYESLKSLDDFKRFARHVLDWL